MSGQKFIKRNRPPRVHITYRDPGDPEKLVELPFIMGVMADLSGNASTKEKPPVGERKFMPVDMDNIDNYMRSVAPAISTRVTNKLSENEGEQMSVNLSFNSMDDFSPGAVAQQVPALRALLEARQQLANLQRYMDGKSAAEDQIRKLLSDPRLMEALKDRAPKKDAEGESE